ncbi:hypothetical protein E2562_017011 [Oryza meyeriana var. granulata]|uniref:EF-hand domain-containing protein n=1 Tax=Oryza meyeriana var. granulata TaxID=110450 RepID=A0A6G1ECT3_9ORYZ|nr:hypothetical protein E2562_017011 [Oryza meyeriana var. granulata]
MAELEQVFRRYDANSDGKISAEELASVLRAQGRHQGRGDYDCDGFVDLSEFAAFHCGPPPHGTDRDKDQEAASKAELREAFRMYDANSNGKISVQELHRVLRQLGEKRSVIDCSHMIRSVANYSYMPDR